MAESEHISMILLDKLPKWQYPVGSTLPKDGPDKAMAVVCDACYEDGFGNGFTSLKNAIELDGTNIIYHSIDTLTDIN